MDNNYLPKPIDTSAIKVDSRVLKLVELLAEHAHDTWAEQRIREGWVYGKERCDKSRRHPCLIPYANLPDNEKQYDRNAAVGTIKAILALGFRIERPETPTDGG